jgi:hypothetical protein
MAYGFSLLDGKQGIAGWAWIFVRVFYALSDVHFQPYSMIVSIDHRGRHDHGFRSSVLLPPGRFSGQ